MANEKLSAAKRAKNDEFYTQYEDIQYEINAYLEYNPDVFRGKTVLLPCDDPEWSNFTRFFAQNFVNLGLRKLISTGYSLQAKRDKYGTEGQLSLFEAESPKYDKEKAVTRGKIFTLTRDSNASGYIDIEDLEWDYLEGDGDFRSEEVTRLRDEADIIVTNPPFSLFREFVAWIMEGNKRFLIIGNKNCITYKEIFPLIKENKMWVGCKSMSSDIYFIIPTEYKERLIAENREGSGYKTIDGVVYGRTSAVWFTNIEHGRRHQMMSLMTMADNLKFSKHKQVRELGYRRYDNYDAIEVPYTDAIPSDYDGVMGVPISFLDKYNPEQFEIVGMTKTPIGNHLRTKIYEKQIQHNPNGTTQNVTKANDGAVIVIEQGLNNKPYYEVSERLLEAVYPRILIRKKVTS